MRLATWNVAWMNALFDDDGRLREDDGPSGRHGVTRADQLAAIGIVRAAAGRRARPPARSDGTALDRGAGALARCHFRLARSDAAEAALAASDHFPVTIALDL
ncbi:MAG: hypothetical protein ACK4TB_04405 [Gemmobacter sp.]